MTQVITDFPELNQACSANYLTPELSFLQITCPQYKENVLYIYILLLNNYLLS